MLRYPMLRYTATTLLLLGACPSLAQTVVIDGTRQNTNALNPPGTGRCVPPYFNTVDISPSNGSSTGTTAIGTFTTTQSHCIVTAPPTSIVDGKFTYNFTAGDSITGTYTGSVATSATPGTFNATENLIVTGGTGRFAGATGTIKDVGPLQFVNGSGVFSGTLSGSLNATATTAMGNYATAFGQATAAMGDYASAFGGLAIANGVRASALGSDAQAIGIGATAVGDETIANGQAATALGQLAQANGPAATALGHNTTATGVGATAVGVRSAATALGATAVGRLSSASASNATALGASASATFAGSTALGTGATTTAANQVVIGGAGSSVQVGDIVASTAAQSGTVAVATVDANGTLGRNASLISNVAALQSASTAQTGQLSMLDSRVSSLFDVRNLDRSDFKKGVAAAVAMGQAPFPSAPGKTSYVLNGSVFRGEVAVGGSLMYRFNTATVIALGVGFSYAGDGNNAFRAGVAGEF